MKRRSPPLFFLPFCLILWFLLWTLPAQASPLADRISQYPNWSEKPPVQTAQADLIYPNWFAGTWTVRTTLVDLVSPLAPEVVTPGFAGNRPLLNRPITFQARFLPEQQPQSPRAGRFPRGVRSRNLTPSAIVADRACNGFNLIQAYLAASGSLEKSPVLAVKADPADPNRQITVLRDDRQLITTITARATETPDPEHFITSEIFQQEFRGAPQLYFNQVETTTTYQHLNPPSASPASDEPVITADQITAIYLSPQDPDYFKAGDRPVALYRYQLEFFRPQIGALLNPAMKLSGGGTLRAPPPLNFIAKISNASNSHFEIEPGFSAPGRGGKPRFGLGAPAAGGRSQTKLRIAAATPKLGLADRERGQGFNINVPYDKTPKLRHRLTLASRSFKNIE